MASEFQELFTLALDYASSPSLSILKKRFANFELCNDKATAAAFGYFAAMRDGEEKEEEEEDEEDPDVGDQICAIMDKVGDYDDPLTSVEATEITMGLIYKWLDEAYEEEGLPDDGLARTLLRERFAPLVKPDVIS